MLAFEIEQAIREVEETTEGLLTAEASDLVALCRALDHRADAITKLALLSEESKSASLSGENAALERLTNVLVKGEEATRALLKMRRDTVSEMGRLTNVRRTIPETEQRGEFDLKG